MKSIDKKKLDQLFELSISYGNLKISFMKEKNDLTKYFSHEDNLKNFPPDGILNFTELDLFFLIKNNNDIVGFYRIIDLYFDNTVELHGGFNKYDSFLIRSYFELTKKFVQEVFKIYYKYKISSLVHISNKRVIKFLHYLNFIDYGRSPENKNFKRFLKIGITNVKMVENKQGLKNKKQLTLIKNYYLSNGKLTYNHIYKNMDISINRLFFTDKLDLNKKEILKLRLTNLDSCNLTLKKCWFSDIYQYYISIKGTFLIK